MFDPIALPASAMSQIHQHLSVACVIGLNKHRLADILSHDLADHRVSAGIGAGGAGTGGGKDI